VQRGPQDWDTGPSVVDSLWRHKWLVALAVLLGAAAAYGWSARQPERYEATVQLFLSPGAGQGIEVNSDVDPDRVLRNQVELLNSAAVLDQTVALSDRQLTRGQLQDSVSVEAAGDADVITIRVLDATPDGAAQLAELVPRAYQRTLSTRAKQTVAELQRTQNRLETDRAQVTAALRAKPGDASLTADREAIDQELGQAATAKRQAEQIAAAAAARAASLQTPAVVGDEPAQPQPRRAAAVGALLGLAVSVALVSWRTGQQLRGAGGARPDELPELPEEVSRDLAVLAEVDGSANGQPAGDLRLLDPTAQDVQRPEPPWRRGRQGRPERKGVPTKATEVRGPAAGINDFNQLTASIQRIFRSLEGHRYRLYEQNVPQMAADDIAEWFPVDLAVILLENDQGMLQVAGGVGLSSFEEHMTIEDNRELLLQVVEMGSKMVDEQERSRLAAANVPGSQAETLIVVPLIYDQVAFGMLLMGQRGGGGQQAALVEGDVDRVRAWARDISPYLRAWLLLRYLKLRLRMVQ
jgi:capsular polysaccharide biosynthesis protein